MIKTLKARKPKGYDEHPTTIAGHLLRRRKELGLWQREVAERLSIGHETYITWEKHGRDPEIWHWPKIINFLGYDPHPKPVTDGVSDEIERARRRLGWSLSQAGEFLGVDPGTLTKWRSGISVPDFLGDRLDRFLEHREQGSSEVQQEVPDGRRDWTVGQHIRARRVHLQLTRREAAARLGACSNSVLNWEKDQQLPEVRFWPGVIQFLGYDPTPASATTCEKIEQQRRQLGWTYAQTARFIGVDVHTLLRWKDGRSMRLLRRESIDRMILLAETRVERNAG